jgi:tripartite-type tricarboxylate transporter receptor subunit TctC
MRYAIALVAFFGFVNALPAQAQQYPAKPIRLIVPFVAGGSADVLSRVLAQRLNQQYGQQVVVENRPGSGGHVGAEAAARAAPDGYTIVFGTIGIHAAYTIYSKLNYDPSRDLQPVSMYADVPNILVVHPSVPVKNVKEFIALAKSNPWPSQFRHGGQRLVDAHGGRVVQALYRGQSDTCALQGQRAGDAGSAWRPDRAHVREFADGDRSGEGGQDSLARHDEPRTQPEHA